jgi:glutathione S-transferase
MILYHFPTSPFARRVRLVLALKGLSAELRDARANPEFQAEVRRLHPLRTVPVLVDGERVVVDSNAICHYLDRKAPEPPLWPAGMAGAEAFELVALTDGLLSILVDVGTRFAPVKDHAAFPGVRAELVGRAQGGLDRLAERVSRGPLGVDGTLCGDMWSAADIAVYTATAWLEGLPARAPTFEPARNIVALGWTVPAALGSWAARHRKRADVASLG